MPYRRTENVVRRLAAREQTILDAARASPAKAAWRAVQIAAVAERAEIAAGTVYRYFPVQGRPRRRTDRPRWPSARVAAMRAAGDAAPGPLSALAACIATFAARALHERRLAWAVIGEPVEPEIDGLRLEFRARLPTELEARMTRRSPAAHLPDQDARVAAPAIIGALLEGLLGPLAPVPGDAATARESVQTMTLACTARVRRRRCARPRSRRAVRAAVEASSDSSRVPAIRASGSVTALTPRSSGSSATWKPSSAHISASWRYRPAPGRARF